MFLLINIYESETTSAYVANVNKFESFDAAQKEMQKCVQRTYWDYYKTWKDDNEDEDREPRVDGDDTTMFVVGYDYKDTWQIYHL
jgi:hypothetical protein